MYIDIHNRKIHYKKMGQGSPIIFVHGWGGNMYSLHKLALSASKKHTAYIIDLPGFGKSDNPANFWGIEGYGEVVSFFIKNVIKSKTDYAGHSFGGAVGIYITAKHPNLINKLILINSAFRRKNKISTSAKIFKSMPKPKILRNLLYMIFYRDSDLLKFPILEANFRKIITQDMTENSKKIAKKTLIIWGEEDRITPVLWAYELNQFIKGSNVHIFPNEGHRLPIKEPEKVWEVIKKFIEEK